MKKNLIFVIAVFMMGLSVISVAGIGTETNEKVNSQIICDGVEYYALLIAVERFGGMNLTEYAHYIDDDAVSMYNMLLSGGNWESSHIKLLLNENATKESIRNNITQWLDNREDQDDVVLIYFCGHGWRIPFYKRAEGHAHIVPYDASDWHYSNEVITDKELDSWLDELESNKTVVILDSCYSGRMLSLRQEGRVILTAGGKYLLCPVDESEELKHGIFTYFLLQGFNGSADKNNDGWVSDEEAFRYACFSTFRYSFFYQFPFIKLSGITPPQLPYMYDQYQGEIRLVKYS